MKNYTEKKPFVAEEIASLLDAYQMSKQPMQTPDIGYISPNTEPMIEDTLNAISAQEEQSQAPELQIPKLDIPQQPEQNQEIAQALESLQTQAPQPQIQPAPQTKLGQALPRLGPEDRVASLEKLLQQYQDYSKSAQDRLIAAQESEGKGQLMNDFSNAMTQVNEALANRAGITDIKYGRQQYTPTQTRNTKDLLGIEESAISKQASIEDALLDAKSPKPQIYQTKSGVYEVRPDGTINPLVQEPTAVPGQLSEKDKAFLQIQADKLKQNKEIFEESEKRRVEQQERGYKKSKLDSARSLLKDDPRFKKAVEQSMEFDTVGELINEVKAGNSTSIAPLGIKLAKAMGEVGVMTDTDVVRYIQSTKWADQLQGWWKKGAQGELPADVIKGIQSSIGTISNKLNSNINKVYDTASKRLKATYKDMSDEEINDVLGMRPVVQVSEKSELAPQDKQALEWANKNPNDPRAVKIKQKLGM